LHDRLASQPPFSFEEKLAVMEQLLDALALAHREGVVHRDLKPMNVLLDKEGTPKILDFGVSKSYEDEDLTVAGMIIGSPPYMSPEQARAEKVSVQSDIFSFGVMMYELFAGERPFQANSRKDYILDRQNYPRLPRNKLPQRLTQRLAGFPRQLDDMVFAMLEGDPERRPSAQRLKERLALFLSERRRALLEQQLVDQGLIERLPDTWKLPALVASAVVVVGCLLKVITG
jgi:serine/threonine protein kinase